MSASPGRSSLRPSARRRRTRPASSPTGTMKAPKSMATALDEGRLTTAGDPYAGRYAAVDPRAAPGAPGVVLVRSWLPAAPLGLRTGPPDEPFADEKLDEPDWLGVPATVAGACGRVPPGTPGSFGRLDGEGGGGEHEQSEEGEEISNATDATRVGGAGGRDVTPDDESNGDADEGTREGAVGRESGGGGVIRGVAAVVSGAEGVATVADVETMGIDGVVTVVDGSDCAATVVVGT
jgi:hypothetical protein